jgi:hypothetical protein
VLVDVEGGHVVGLLPDRSADSFSAWLVPARGKHLAPEMSATYVKVT